MDVLSAAMEAAAAADAASSAPSSVTSSPRPGSPANSTSTKDGAAGGSSNSTNKAETEIHEARLLVAATAAAAVTGGGPAVPAVSQAIRDAHAKLEAQAEDIRNGQCGVVEEKDMFIINHPDCWVVGVCERLRVALAG